MYRYLHQDSRRAGGRCTELVAPTCRDGLRGAAQSAGGYEGIATHRHSGEAG